MPDTEAYNAAVKRIVENEADIARLNSEVRRIQHELDMVRKSNHSLKGTLDMTSATNDRLLEMTRVLRVQEEVRTKKLEDLKVSEASLLSYLKEQMEKAEKAGTPVDPAKKDKAQATLTRLMEEAAALDIPDMTEADFGSPEVDRFAAAVSEPDSLLGEGNYGVEEHRRSVSLEEYLRLSRMTYSDKTPANVVIFQEEEQREEGQDESQEVDQAGTGVDAVTGEA